MTSPYPPPARQAVPPTAWTASQQVSTPSGLFPSGPPRPIYREAFPVRGGAVALGMIGGGMWMMLFGLLATNARGYAWISLIAGILGWLVALLLTRIGDRAAAVGIAISVAFGLSITVVVIAARWIGGEWLLW